MSPIRFPDPLRADYLARLRSALRNTRVPGGDVAAWLAPLPTECLAVALLYPRHRTAEILFQAVGVARGAGRLDPAQDLFVGDRTNVPASLFAECAVVAWSACRLAREHLDAGRAEDAQRLLIGLTRWIHDWPTRLARHFEPRIEALYVAADRLRDRQRADEVA